jgi:hypothetical protein
VPLDKTQGLSPKQAGEHSQQLLKEKEIIWKFALISTCIGVYSLQK